MGNNDEQAPPPYNQAEDAITPQEKPLAESRQRQLAFQNVSSISPALAAPNNPIILTRLCGKGSGTKLIVSTRTSLEAYNAQDGTRLWEIQGRDPAIMSDGIPTQFTNKLSSSYDGDLLSALVDHDAENPRFIIIDANTGKQVHRFKLHKDCGDFTCLSQDKPRLGMFYWTKKESTWVVAQPIKPPSSEKSKSFWAENLPSGRCATMAFAPDDKHLIVCQGPDLPLANGTNDINTRRHGQMGKNSEKMQVASKAKKDANRRSKNMDFTVNICVYNLAREECVRRINFPGKPAGALGVFDVFQRPAFTPQFHFPNNESWLVSFPDYGSASGNDIRIVDAGTGQTETTITTKQSMVKKMRAGSTWSLFGHDSKTGIWTRLEEKPAMMMASHKTLTVTKWREESRGFTRANPMTETLAIGSGDSCSLSPDGTYLAIQRAGEIMIDIVALECRF